MGLTTILLLFMVTYTCTAALNDSSVSWFSPTREPADAADHPDRTMSNITIALSEIFIVTEMMGPQDNPKTESTFPVSINYETIDISSEDQETPNCSPKQQCRGLTIYNYAPTDELHSKDPQTDIGPGPVKNNQKKFRTEHPHNVTDLGAKLNKTKQISKTFTISREAVLFLKGLLVTRVMPSFYILLFLISLPLNALALVTFICKIKAKKPAVIYMSHLACVDLLFTLLLPLKIHYYLNGSHWVFGEVACRVLSAVYYCYMYCSILLMMCMSVDRLVAVVFPVASLTWRSTRKSMCVCVLVWLLAIAGTAPLLSIQQTFKIENVGITCHDALIHDNAKDQQYVYLFSILSSLFFFLPLVVTLVCYTTIIYVLSAKSDRLATTSSTSDKRRRAVIMTIAVATEFVACFAPSNGILLYHCDHLARKVHSWKGNASYMAYMFAVCVGSSSVFLDPLLYYYGSSQCRERIRSVLRLRKTERAKTMICHP